MSRLTGHATLQEILGIGGAGTARSSNPRPPLPLSPTKEEQRRRLLQLLPAGFEARVLGANNKRPRPKEEEEEPPVGVVESEGGQEEEDKEQSGPKCPCCRRPLRLFASFVPTSSSLSPSQQLDLDAVNRHVDACLIARSRGADPSSDKRKKNKNGGGQQASLLMMTRKVTATAEVKEEKKEEAEVEGTPLPPTFNLPALSETCFETRLVSRRHASRNAGGGRNRDVDACTTCSTSPSTPSTFAAGTTVSLVRERSNAADGAAVRAVAFPGPGGSLGYLPSSVAREVALLLDLGGKRKRERKGAATVVAAATATLCEDAKADETTKSVRVRVEVVLVPWGGEDEEDGDDDNDSSSVSSSALRRLVAAAAAAAADDLRLSYSGPGGRLLSAALPVLDAALTPPTRGGDSHLFLEEELRLLRSLRPTREGEKSDDDGGSGRGSGISPEAAALFLRVYCSRRPTRWVRPSKLAISSSASASSCPASSPGAAVRETAAAAEELVAAGLAAPLALDGDDDGTPPSCSLLLAAADALTVEELREALSSSSLGVRRMNRSELLAHAAGLLLLNGGGRRRHAVASALTAALAAPPALNSPSTSSSIPFSSSIPAFRLRTVAMRALRRAERAAFLSESVTLPSVAASLAGGGRELPRHRRVERVRSEDGRSPAPPPVFASRREFLDRERALEEAAALDEALLLSLSSTSLSSASSTTETAAERSASADAVVEAAMRPCVDFVLRRQQSSDAGAGEEEIKDENSAPPPPLSSVSPPKHERLSGSSSFFLSSLFSASSVRIACATVSASWLESKKRRNEADELYWGLLGLTSPEQQQQQQTQTRRRGHWWTRLAINAEASGRPGQALEIVEAALADDGEASVAWGDRLGLMRRGHRLARPPRRWKAPPAAWSIASTREPREKVIVASMSTSGPSAVVGAKSIFEGDLTVEQLALEHYSRPENGGWRGAHAEGGVWGVLFRALMHDAMFSPDEDDDDDLSQFLRVPCQRYPLDFGTPEFYRRRRGAIDAALARIRRCDERDSDTTVADLVTSAWDRGLGCYAAGGAEGRWNLNRSPRARGELRELCECLGGRALAAVMSLFARGVAGSGGMPDLVLWRRRRESPASDLAALSSSPLPPSQQQQQQQPSSSSSSPPRYPTAMVVEVKGPRDRLSDNQRAWLAALEDECGLEAEVLKVVETGSSRAKKVAQKK